MEKLWSKKNGPDNDYSKDVLPLTIRRNKPKYKPPQNTILANFKKNI